MARSNVVRSIRRPLDSATAAAGMARPGMDPRQWVSYGVVHATDPKAVVTFDEEYGQPLVCVTLQPSGMEVHCRVSSMIAGNGEGEYHPFIELDEVIVVIPEGNEAAGPVIVGRLNNAIDKFPMDSVAGQDPTTNTFAFRRRRTPHIEELAGPIMFRSAPTGAFLSIDALGVVSLRDGEKNAVQLSADVFGFVSGDGRCVLQLSLTNQQFILQIGGAYMQLSNGAGDPNTILVPGPFVLGTSGFPPAEHVLTVESFIAFFKTFLTLNGTTLGFIPNVTLDTMLAAIVTGSLVMPLTDTPMTLAALATAFASPIPKPPVDPVTNIQQLPGLGCRGFLVG